MKGLHLSLRGHSKHLRTVDDRVLRVGYCHTHALTTGFKKMFAEPHLLQAPQMVQLPPFLPRTHARSRQSTKCRAIGTSHTLSSLGNIDASHNRNVVCVCSTEASCSFRPGTCHSLFQCGQYKAHTNARSLVVRKTADSVHLGFVVPIVRRCQVNSPTAGSTDIFFESLTSSGGAGALSTVEKITTKRRTATNMGTVCLEQGILVR